jgi:hypothetical protein
MQLYNSIGPNPKVVRMFMAEKGSSCRGSGSTSAVARTSARCSMMKARLSAAA